MDAYIVRRTKEMPSFMWDLSTISADRVSLRPTIITDNKQQKTTPAATGLLNVRTCNILGLPRVFFRVLCPRERKEKQQQAQQVSAGGASHGAG